MERERYQAPFSFLPLGKLCQWTDACLSHPCANGSTCTSTANQFSCKCPAGITGQKCETDINECADVPARCQHGGTCLNLPGSYQCQCPQGFTGQHCDSPYVPCAPSPCVNGGTCRQTGDFTFECNCLPGKELPRLLGMGVRGGGVSGWRWRWSGLDPPLGKRGSESVVWGGLLVREGFYGLTVVYK